MQYNTVRTEISSSPLSFGVKSRLPQCRIMPRISLTDCKSCNNDGGITFNKHSHLNHIVITQTSSVKPTDSIDLVRDFQLSADRISASGLLASVSSVKHKLWNVLYYLSTIQGKI